MTLVLLLDKRMPRKDNRRQSTARQSLQHLPEAEISLPNQSTCKRVSPQALEAFCVAAFIKAGMREEHAKLIADVLVTTDTWGIYTHGSYRLSEYVQK